VCLVLSMVITGQWVLGLGILKRGWIQFQKYNNNNNIIKGTYTIYHI
jgi:hypothetical protein